VTPAGAPVIAPAAGADLRLAGTRLAVAGTAMRLRDGANDRGRTGRG